MPNYIKDIFSRMDLQQIREFLLYETSPVEIDTRPYEERLKDDSESIVERLKQLYPDEREFDKAMSDYENAVAASEAVYLEIGMKAGARLLFQLLCQD
ncbi:MAG: hypothetical protein FWD71_11695 [Oscillospiraceae bacterium]|nr:hypothetical protein [Oscillospiraceae bacterium]